MPAKKKGEKSMRLKKSRIPKFKTYEEEANFWDTHSFVDFEDELEDVEIVFDLKKSKNETLVIEVQKNVKQKLDKIAKAKGVNAENLISAWLTKKTQAM